MSYSGPVRQNPPTGESPIWQFGYVPSVAMGAIGVALMLIVATAHAFYLFTKRGTRSVHLLFAFAAATSALGFGARLYCNTWEFDGMGFLVAVSLLPVATIFLTAALYKSIQRNAKYYPDGHRLSPMRPRSMLAVFLILDVIFVLMQVGGQYLASSAEAADQTDEEPMFAVGTSTLIYLSGNVLQLISLAVFASFVLVIKRRAARFAAATSSTGVAFPLHAALLTQILISLGLFFVRLIVRIAYGAQGIFGYAATHEWVFGVFEFTPIFLILALWAARPLHRFLFPNQPHGAATGDVAPSNASASDNGVAPAQNKV